MKPFVANLTGCSGEIQARLTARCFALAVLVSASLACAASDAPPTKGQPAPAAPAKAPSAASQSAVKLSSETAEIVKLLDAGISPIVIKTYIENSPKTCLLSADEIVALQQHGASSDIIEAMIRHAATQPAQTEPGQPPLQELPVQEAPAQQPPVEGTPPTVVSPMTTYYYPAPSVVPDYTCVYPAYPVYVPYGSVSVGVGVWPSYRHYYGGRVYGYRYAAPHYYGHGGGPYHRGR